ncbi:MAG: glucose-6-phosphate dehydrogenase, partial [Parcubacteria group bacterium]|nr:glucose-6-phosphate dehydrogenase [Parcubacteria group bacterium]
IGQNHMMQTLALIAMEDPGGLDGNAIRNARANVLKALLPIKPRNLAKRVTLGQYRGFTGGPEVPKSSKTETYFKIRASIGNKRWKGVPVTLEAGKALKEDCKKIVITFKERPTCVCHVHDSVYLQNVLEFHIAPHEGISLKFWAKKKGFTMDVEPRELSFTYRTPDDKMHPHDAYEQLLFDAVRGEQTLFASTDEVRAAWKFITPILEHWSTIPLKTYERGSSGPKTERHGVLACPPGVPIHRMSADG